MAQDMARHPGYAHLKKLSVMLDFLVTAVFIACVGAYALEWKVPRWIPITAFALGTFTLGIHYALVWMTLGQVND